jgi:SSS family solute:Na+ symporter
LPLLPLLHFFLIALYYGRGHKNQLEQWSIGGRSFGVILVFILLGGELYTTFTFLGGSSLAYNKGGACYYILCYSPIAYIFGYWFAPAIWKYANQYNLVSQSDFFIHKYNSKTLGFLVSVIGVISLIPYLILQIKSLGIIVSETSYGIISNNYAIWICSALLVIYVVVSGMHGSVRVALIKDFMIIIIVFFLGVYLPYHYYGGITPMITTLELKHPGFTAINNTDFNPVWFMSTVLLSAIGLYMWPHSFTSLYTAHSPQILKKNAIIMPLYQFLLMFVFIIGFVAALQLTNIDKAHTDLALLRLVKQSFSPWFVGIVGSTGILTALVPGSMILLSMATLVVKNIIVPLFPLASHKETLLSKICVPIIMLITLIANSYDGKTIVDLLIMAYGLVSQIFPALLFSLFKRNPISKIEAIAGIFVGSLLMFISVFSKIDFNHYLPTSLHGLNIGIIALCFNLSAIIIIMAITHIKLQLFAKLRV